METGTKIASKKELRRFERLENEILDLKKLSESRLEDKNALQKELFNSRAENAKLQQDIADSKLELAISKQEIANTHKSVVDLQNEITDLKILLNALKQKLEHEEEKLDNKRTHFETLWQLLEDVVSSLKNLENEISVVMFENK